MSVVNMTPANGSELGDRRYSTPILLCAHLPSCAAIGWRPPEPLRALSGLGSGKGLQRRTEREKLSDDHGRSASNDNARFDEARRTRSFASLGRASPRVLPPDNRRGGWRVLMTPNVRSFSPFRRSAVGGHPLRMMSLRQSRLRSRPERAVYSDLALVESPPDESR